MYIIPIITQMSTKIVKKSKSRQENMRIKARNCRWLINKTTPMIKKMNKRTKSKYTKRQNKLSKREIPSSILLKK